MKRTLRGLCHAEDAVTLASFLLVFCGLKVKIRGNKGKYQIFKVLFRAFVLTTAVTASAADSAI